jgi:hypothetical protein
MSGRIEAIRLCSGTRPATGKHSAAAAAIGKRYSDREINHNSREDKEMARRNAAVVQMEPKAAGKNREDGMPRSLEIAARGVQTGGHFANLMSAVMSDLIDGRLTPSVGNAVCNAGGKLLKVVEMQQRWGTSKSEGGPRDLLLTVGEPNGGKRN